MFHRVTIIGRVGSEPQMRYAANERAVTNVSVATTSTISKERSGSCPQGWKESFNEKNWELTTWFRVAVWGAQAEAVNAYVHTGMLVFVEGELRGDATNGAQNPRVWTDNSGEHRASYEVVARNIKFLTRAEAAEAVEEEEQDTLPF